MMKLIIFLLCRFSIKQNKHFFGVGVISRALMAVKEISGNVASLIAVLNIHLTKFVDNWKKKQFPNMIMK